MLHNTPRTFIGATTLQILGMGSSACAAAVVNEVRAVQGVAHVTADIITCTITVRASEPVDRADIEEAVRRVGLAVTD
ncbi:hypothetical protein DDP54_08645 [Cellulomonas sp. WB94]|uniref:heavy-metal-associated domain-containing protein n=1 Tax=Cellulomonas sp. WB94 TaxID=2173174 RepID=UPI000D567D7F|nr:heavy metal-associated domain-containing protein [Cellulomonas sp. WB94]PVU83058.1 hypothetical protein DDP54_08645 [Cellulomonas sp. WB94]